MTTTRAPQQLRLVLVVPQGTRATGMRGMCGDAGVAVLDRTADAGFRYGSETVEVHDDPTANRVEGAAADADVLRIDHRGTDATRAAVGRARIALAAAGRTIGELRIAVRLAVVTGATDALAHGAADRLGLDPVTRANALVGTPERVAGRLASFARSGEVDLVDLSPTLGTEHNHDALAGARALRAVLRDVVPRLGGRGLVAASRRASAAEALGLHAPAARTVAPRVAFGIGETDIPPGW
ncbi:LLM class flavin-dependent oxidoreductase [Pseudoclavibacter chungangensis]|uniref:LLM class flavin-dependent oxidoreductase n=1 Tax=Pseudoclavibacter chungangensis TaxID=587635 RepID=A0A7J5BZF1_9MICO|nr:LLM class flavin-dependent oxidoreductase [Pseudoclavibacter chungangensis]KAB1659524.1 LLM class flavin-dependent oxidoreductase [Pseudoclavibacter chungangensis]NYJ67613.1 hypothetical protein [Pseudoclavibacter chungangensis]